ncbi:MAG: NAD(P)-dependent oxidoreductase [Nanoarchaeota archaeon]
MFSSIIQEKISKRENFFEDSYLKNAINTKEISVIVVLHLLDTGVPYINIIQKYFSLECIIPKQKSINANFLRFYKKERICNLSREQLKDFNSIKNILQKIPQQNKLIILDIGGYFSNIGNDIKDYLGNRFLGIIEDTENGHQKYAIQDKINYPIISVARSPLKENEDYLVGQSVVFSADAILREQGILLNNKKTGIIGFGKIGNGILSSLKEKGCDILIYDINPITLIKSYSKGNKITSKIKLLESSDMIFCSSGNLSLKEDEFKYLKGGAFLASVTSSDDEMNISWLEKEYKKEIVSNFIVRYNKNSHYIYIINNGDAINFLHGAVVDDFILLVQKEIINAILYMRESKLKNTIQEIPEFIREGIADLWLKYFLLINV